MGRHESGQPTFNDRHAGLDRCSFSIFSFPSNAQAPGWSQALTINDDFPKDLAGVAAGSRIFFAGGTTESIPRATIDIFDLSTGLPSSDSTLTVARYGLVGATAGSKVFFSGGQDAVDLISDVIDVYDLELNDTLLIAPLVLQTPRTKHASCASGNLVFFAGGITSVSPLLNATSSVEVYNVLTGDWTYFSLALPRYGIACAVYGDKVYFAGGRTQHEDGDVIGLSVATVDIFDIISETWDSPQNLTFGR